jgi:2-oxoglutarate ferredoxin oxidoreductase subunit delta
MKGKVVINPEMCKGCRLCIGVCPKNVLAPSSKNNSLGAYIAEVKKAEECIGCCRCAMICPDVAIEVFRI